MSNLILLTLLVLACYRLTMLLTWDVGPFAIFANVRALLGKQAAQGNKIWRMLAELFHCPYCMGIWIALFLTLIITPSPLLWWFGVAGGQALLTRLAGPKDDE